MADLIDIIGRKYGRLVVVGYAGFERHHARWRCVCECGTERTVMAQKLRKGLTKSCGCMKAELSAARLREKGFSAKVDDTFLVQHLSVDRETGRVIVARPFGRRGVGDILDFSSRDGRYRVVRIGRGNRWLAHRIVWSLTYGEWPSQLIDHRDRDGTNNRIMNLRSANKSQNNANSKSRGESGVKGVTRLSSGRFCARITESGRTKYLGSFDTQKEAADAYTAASLQSFGEFARLS